MKPESDAADDFAAFLAAHEDCAWQQAGLCVWCVDHGLRLFQGSLPESKRTVPKCAPDQHDWDPDMGLGFYVQCRACGFTEWCE